MSFRSLLSSLGLKGAEKRGEQSERLASPRSEDIEIPYDLGMTIFPDVDPPYGEPIILSARLSPDAHNYEAACIQSWLLRREIERWIEINQKNHTEE